MQFLYQNKKIIIIISLTLLLAAIVVMYLQFFRVKEESEQEKEVGEQTKETAGGLKVSYPEKWEVGTDTYSESENRSVQRFEILSEDSRVIVIIRDVTDEFLSTVEVDEYGVIGGGHIRFPVDFVEEDFVYLGKLDDTDIYRNKTAIISSDGSEKLFQIYSPFDEGRVTYNMHLFSADRVPEEATIGIEIASDLDDETFNQRLKEAEDIILSLEQTE